VEKWEEMMTISMDTPLTRPNRKLLKGGTQNATIAYEGDPPRRTT